MICPNCAVQMHQFRQIGGGIAEHDFYETWEIKKCPSCGRLVKESYECKVITLSQAQKLERDLGHIVDVVPEEEE